jgi:PhnB protein
MTQISPMLAVADGKAAIEFYRNAFGAEVLWQIDAGGGVVAGMAIHGAQFFLASESPDYGTRSPSAAGFTTVRIELFVDDPVAVHQKAVAAGAKNREGVIEHNYQTEGPKPIGRMLQGSVFDPSGHMWLIGRIL